jgi:hypothetical protein
MSCAGCFSPDTNPAVPPPEKPELSEICTVIEPHHFADATLGFFGANRHDPAVVADLDWIADVAKVRRCLCDPVAADQDGTDRQDWCPAVDRKRVELGPDG